MKCPCADVRHTLRYFHLFEHHRVAEHLRRNPPDARRNPNHTGCAAVPDKVLVLLDCKTAQRAVKQKPYHLRNIFRKDILIPFQHPFLSPKHNLPECRTA
jgi:hypothetical protein